MRSRRSILIGGILSAGLLSVAACSSSAPGAPTVAPGGAGASVPPISLPSGLGGGGGAPAAASLLTADAAAAIIGGTPTLQPGSITLGPMSIMSYGTDSGDSVTILLEAVPAGVQASALQAAMAMQGTTGSMQPVSGIGDAAGKVVTDHEATLAFTKGSTLVVLSTSVSSAAGTDLEPKLESLAQQITGKL